MFDIKTVVSLVAIALVFIGFAPYVRDILLGKTKPHIFSWFVWGVTTSIIYFLQVSGGAGSGAWVTLSLSIVLFIILFLSLKNGSASIKKIDVVFLVLALLAIPLWLNLKQPVLSIILLSTIDMLGFAPTVRKSWNDPYSETLSLYVITTFRHGLSFFALAQYNIVTWLFPVTWIFANAAFAIILIIRRKVKNKLDKVELR